MSCKKCKCKVCSCIKNDVPKIAVNGVVQNPNEKSVVNIKVPTKTSQLINDSGFGQGNGGGTGGQKIENLRVNGELVPIINKEAIMNVPTKTGLVKQSTIVANSTTTLPTSGTSSTATDIETLKTDLNDLISKYNSALTVITDLQAKLNSKLQADRDSGQQAT